MKLPSVSTPLNPIAVYHRAHLDHRLPYVQLLANEQMQTMLTAAGSGYVRFRDFALTRWSPDRTRDAEGYTIYLRDLDTNHYWSTGYQPTGKEPDDYQVRFFPGRAEFVRVDYQLQTKMEVCVATDADLDLRRCTITNFGSTPRTIELTSYAEMVLGDSAADRAHPAFSKLFVETEYLEDGALLARRRQRRADESTIAACHFIAGSPPTTPDEFETDRCLFIGRGQSLAFPRALRIREPLSGATGSVLDAILSLRRVLFLSPGESASITFVLAGAGKQLDASDLLDRFREPGSEAIESAFESASLVANQHFRRCDITESQAEGILHLASKSLYGGAEKTNPSILNQPEQDPLSSELQKSVSELAELSNSLSNGYLPNSLAFSSTKVDAFLECFGFTNKISEEEFPIVSAAVSAERQSAPSALKATTLYSPCLESGGGMNKTITEPLQHFNGWGGFSADGSEYVIRVRSDGSTANSLPPAPWCNVIANEQVGFVVSETGAGFTWVGNSQLNRLTPWSNDLVTDPHGEALYIRDEDAGVYWTPTPGPVPRTVDYQVRHGFGYTTFLHESNDLKQEVVQFVPRADALKITLVRLTNLSDRVRRLSLFSYHSWEMGDGRSQSTPKTQTTIDASRAAIFAVNTERDDFSQCTAFSALVANGFGSENQFTCDRAEFLGRHGSMSKPRALGQAAPLPGRSGAGLDPCAVCKTEIEIPPGQTYEFAVLLGAADSQDESAEMLDRYQTPESWSQSLCGIQQFWKEKLSAVQIETPSSPINLMVNGWLAYQDLSCRIWGRSSAYQSGGAYGFRDQLQDAAALIHHCPELTREQILKNAAHQFVEGDVLHWWHPPKSRGIRTAFSDDLLWLPLLAAEYVETTGDHSLWQENVRFISGPQLPVGEAEIALIPNKSNESDSVYEHCCRALDRGLTRGPNGLPLIGCGDWNDGMNRVGQAGMGESVWLGFFIDIILRKMLPVCKQFGDSERILAYTNYRGLLRTALNDAGWDGKWYRRAFFDDGTPLGTSTADECRIDALVQAWAVLSGVAPDNRAASAIAAAESQLVDEQAKLIRLLDPPFDRMKNDPGYIKGYVPGVRENGGQYTHGVLWLVRAVAELGRGSRAVELLEMLSPVSHGNSRDSATNYKVEPYVVAADVYSQLPHVGRGGWSWYTGSAGWMLRVAVESILGLHLEAGQTLRLDPRISVDWPECRIWYRLSDGQTQYEIHIKNPNGKELGVVSAEVDRRPIPIEAGAAMIPLQYDGKKHLAIVWL